MLREVHKIDPTAQHPPKAAPRVQPSSQAAERARRARAPSKPPALPSPSDAQFARPLAAREEDASPLAPATRRPAPPTRALPATSTLPWA